MAEFTVEAVTVFRAASFLTKRSAKYKFLEIYVIFHITNTTDLDFQMWFQ